MAGVLLIGGVYVSWRTRGALLWHSSTVALVALAVVPLIQRATGQVHSSGVAWVVASYLGAAAIVMMVAARHEASASSTDSLDILFLAILLGTLVSVFLQLNQWLDLELSDIWLMESSGERPYANLGQPNQLATLLGWGIVSVAWFHHRGKVHRGWAWVAALILVSGMSLTRSRTALLLLAWLVVTGGILYFKARDKRYWMPSLLLFGTYCLSTWALPIMRRTLFDMTGGVGAPRVMTDSASVNVRKAIYQLFLDASWRRPWSGYGWGQSVEAQLEVTGEHQPLHMLVSHTHNLLLDLVIAMGWPLGAICFGFVAWWWLLAYRRAQGVETLLPLTAITFVGIHAMLELPIHYGYFLWPAAWLIGVLNHRLVHRAVSFGGRTLLLWFIGLAMSFYAAVLYDYIRVEENWRAIRFEQNRVGTRPAPPTPDTLVLSQLEDLLWLARVEPSRDIGLEQLQRLEYVVRLYPSLPAILKIARAYALNDDKINAQRWLSSIPAVASEAQADIARIYWNDLKDSRYANVPWPYP